MRWPPDHSVCYWFARRFVSETLYAIAARGSVRLSEIGHAPEEAIPMAKTETRLSRNLGRPELRDRGHAGSTLRRSRPRWLWRRPGWIKRTTDAIEADATDVVYIASPPADHKGHVLAVAEAGKAVFCEKPLRTAEQYWSTEAVA